MDDIHAHSYGHTHIYTPLLFPFVFDKVTSPTCGMNRYSLYISVISSSSSYSSSPFLLFFSFFFLEGCFAESGPKKSVFHISMEEKHEYTLQKRGHAIPGFLNFSCLDDNIIVVLVTRFSCFKSQF